MKSGFRNVDLAIFSRTPLDLIAEEVGRKAFILFCGRMDGRSRRYLLSLELKRVPRNPDASILALCELAGGLSTKAKQLWKACEPCFDIGYDMTEDGSPLQFTLKPDTLNRIQRLGASLKITCYKRVPEIGD